MITKFDYKLTGTGWATLTLETDTHNASILASYCTDPLPDLLSALVRLRKKELSVELVIFDGEGRGITEMLLTILPTGDLRIEVFDNARFDESGLDERTPMPFFTAYDNLRDFAWYVHQNISQLLDTVGAAGYKEQWVRSPFPLEEFNAIKPLLSHP